MSTGMHITHKRVFLTTYIAHPKLEVPFVVAIALIFLETLEDVVQLCFQVVAASGIKGYAPARARRGPTGDTSLLSRPEMVCLWLDY